MAAAARAAIIGVSSGLGAHAAPVAPLVYAICPNEKSRKAPKIYLWDDNIDVEIFKTTTKNPV